VERGRGGGGKKTKRETKRPSLSQPMTLIDQTSSCRRNPPGYSDKPLGLDLTVTCPLNKTLIQTASKQELYAACKAAALKDRLQKDDLENLGYSLMPLAFETTGGHTEEVATLVHYIAKEKQFMTGIPFSENVTRLWELLSTTLQRANAFAIK